eukprot:CAMPEP_0178525846 /NCGR_PEP_ID=MMETSP0696-20121128/30404_1 /TAXON_ID=265572 /ORGANISM="Extubocellulus spinifer, Strain CCMP396" /LENGTH=40 /DNA_ID= /DNA_START= /DNA_END= /DNA_ORIENTATION=
MACDAVFEGVDVLNSKSYDSGIANQPAAPFVSCRFAWATA